MMFTVLSSRQDISIARIHAVHLQTKHRVAAAANPQTKSIDLAVSRTSAELT